MIVKQQEQGFMEENMSNNNLTCAPCGEPSVSSTSLVSYHQEQYVSQQIISQDQDQQPATKKKRSLPGNPDPEAEVIALSPKSLLATNRFVCEICNKGFQRDQNLQLHRRGHNLPWKLKQRNNKEIIRKKVYVCPEPSCVHHDPSRALGDLTGIKKHFCRKHGEKKWKCEKCSKRYAVQSDWKAHSKVCGTREYRCDCGTLFSRRDSFITHRAFCDALAEETARSITTNSFLPNPITVAGSSTTSHLLINLQQQQQQPMLFNNTQQQQQQQQDNPLHSFPLIKKEQQQQQQQQPNLMINTLLPSWLDHHLSSPSSSPSTIFHHHHQDNVGNPSNNIIITSNNNSTIGGPISGYHGTYHTQTLLSSPHMSATALLQKAAQMGATMSKHQQHPQCHVTDTLTNNTTTSSSSTGLFGLNTSTTTHGNGTTLLVDPGPGPGPGSGLGLRHGPGPGPGSLLHDMMMNTLPSSSSYDHHDDGGGQFARGKNGNEGMTRDFLGLRSLSQSEILSIAGLEDCLSNHNVDNNSHDRHQRDTTHKQPWQG